MSDEREKEEILSGHLTPISLEGDDIFSSEFQTTEMTSSATPFAENGQESIRIQQGVPVDIYHATQIIDMPPSVSGGGNIPYNNRDVSFAFRLFISFICIFMIIGILGFWRF